MKIKHGEKEITKKGERRKAIVEFDFNNYILYVFKGDLSAFDILIKYKKDNLRIRTPKHIHWAVDMLIKLQCQKRLAQKFLNKLKDIWNECLPLQNNDYETIKTLVEREIEKIDLAQYEKLSSAGEYPVDFLFVLMILLSTQEKTNRSDAYMFGSIIDELLVSDYDIFKVVSAAGYTGKNKNASDV